MIIKEFASSLNIMGILSNSEDYGLASISREFGTKYASKIRRKDDGGFRVVNVPRVHGMQKEEIEQLNAKGTFDGNGWYILKENLDKNYFDFFIKLIETPSVVIDSIITKDGIERIYFRAHESDREKIRDLVYKNKKAPKSLFLEKLDKNPGLVEIMKSFDSDIKLSYMEFRMKVPPSAMNIEKDPVISTFGNNWVREMKYLYDDNAYAIYYEKSKILKTNTGITEISRNDNIFRMNYSNPIVTQLVNEATTENIGLMNLAQRMLGRDFYLSFITPKMCLSRMHGIVSDIMQNFTDWDITVSLVRDILDS